MLSNEQIEKNYEEFITLLRTNVVRDSEGLEKLISYLNAKDTKIAPASTKYHGSYAGGLVRHCLNVYKKLTDLIDLNYGVSPYSVETITLVALLHDISKVDFYEIQERNTKDENGNWIKVPYYQVKDTKHRLIYGSHGANSVFKVRTFINLSYEEELAILHHMGGFDYTEGVVSTQNISEVFTKSPLALLLHQADQQATFMMDDVNE